MRARNYDPASIDQFLAIDATWRSQTQEVETMRAEQKKIGEARKIEEAKALKEKIAGAQGKLREVEQERDQLVRLIPNLLHANAPRGTSEEDNIILRTISKKPKLDFPVKDHLELGTNLGIIDTERAAKVSGSRFGYLLGGAAQLELALIQFALNTLTNENLLKKIAKKAKLTVPAKPFTFVIPPTLIKSEMMSAMGYTERGGDEIYKLQDDDLVLVGTAEQALGPMHSDETLTVEELPRRYLGFSSSFRREAGSHGKDTKGILRVHQFDKLEMLSITTKEESENEHKLLLAIQEYLMQSLDLHYQVLNVCSADLGDPAAAKFDIETWMPGQNKYRETSSTSNTTDFQSRRLGIKYRQGQETNFAHLINGTAFAIGRTLIAIIENNQTKQGTVNIPKALQKYTGFKEIKN